MKSTPRTRPHVVIVGAGFGGLDAARALAKAPVRVTVVDRENHHVFQPLLYQVATAALSGSDVAAPARSILSKQRNARVILAEVRDVDLDDRRLILDEGEVRYDYLVLAVGAETSYFGHDDWRARAPGLKSVDDALEIRKRVLLAFEIAEREGDPARRRSLLSFAIIGGGPTGVELAGAIAELGGRVLAKDFRAIDPASSTVNLVEAGPRILPTFDPELSQKAVQQLETLGVHVRESARVTNIDGAGVSLASGEHIDAATVIWAAGVKPVPLVARLGCERDRQGRLLVRRDLSLPEHPEVFAVGDIASLEQDGHPLPGVSPVAKQEGRAAGRNIARDVAGEPRAPFRYKDKGTMATIGRSRAIAQIGRLKLWGFLAWIAWLFVHVLYLIGFRNKLVVLITWAWTYFTYKRGARVITGAPHPPHLLEPEAIGDGAH